ncbi:tripartite tricarboxylate transporter substrate binding protein [Alcaligenes nematophilus]|uniref:Bug family tripartite tricarboxylate transporter substrate binding protein n=1 Tax=Alcaligenes TaxID=507 RepID=UPI001CF6F063|nr:MULTISPECIES: tripartite tricarboxylate transporter substrate binding protein [Alcaligenes]MCB4322628.1 tripartite tricarboxylate transporter substrate binding protein [Alcaligenes sp. 13f]MDH4867487.1 tripartite tricarboxylate transporter substrate binding protein [Bacillus cereus]MDY7128795.1 tripartite tricarboxylate transporter substrate binding protein [Alcaligenes nematophilus]USY25519.1 tripartite tricarboxylate transporter substrate binding protein [Alcaligenes sp. 1735tsa3]
MFASRFTRRALAALALTLSPVAALHAAEPIRLVVGFAPGGGVDTLARVTAQALSKELDRTVIVENKSGAGGTISADYVSKSQADGNTLLFADTSLLVAPYIYPALRYDLQRDFAPIGMVGQSDLALAVPGDSPVKTVAELIEAIRKAPPQTETFASVGVGSVHHLGGELFALQTKTELVHVPYRGGAPASQALASGEVSMSFASLASSIGLANSGRIRLLATLSERRFPGMPDLPSVSETIPGYSVTPSLFMLAPQSVDPALIATVSKALENSMQQKQVQDAFLAQGSVAGYQDAQATEKWLGEETERWANVIKTAQLDFKQ